MFIPFWLSQAWPVTLRIQEQVFSDCTVSPDSKETKLRSSNQGGSISAGKNTGVVLVPRHIRKCVPKTNSGDWIFPRSLWVSFFMTHELSEMSYHELTVYLSAFDPFLSQWIMAILSKGHKPDNFESHNSLKPNFTNIRGYSNFVECDSFLESNYPEIFAPCESNLDDSIDFMIFTYI